MRVASETCANQADAVALTTHAAGRNNAAQQGQCQEHRHQKCCDACHDEVVEWPVVR